MSADLPAYETIRYETGLDLVATITLDRPEVLNAFDRRMCEEIRDAWQRIKADPKVNAVVLRAAGDRAFCAGLDVKKPFGQPDDVWNHEDPGELISPKWQKVWKPVVCAVHGICTAGAFYFLNEADVVICSTDATFFDSHVSIGLVTEVVSRSDLWARAHEIAAGIAAKPTAATQGTVRAIWESLDRPYRAAMEQGLIYTRLGNPLGMAEVAAEHDPPPPRIR
jgi:enoyl-CoA hydratase/carnithine racemase